MHGHFSDEQPLTRWSGNCNMILIEEFTYTDPQGKCWKAPAKSIINGASIPRELWSIVGSPYVGSYRRASIVHDVAVGENNTQTNVTQQERKAADKMFYYACRCGGCGILEANILYIGVCLGTWKSGLPSLWNEKIAPSRLNPKDILSESPEEQYTRSKFAAIVMDCESLLNYEDPDQIQEIIQKHLQ